MVRPDGTERIVHSQGDVTWDASGRPLRQFGVLQDITELRRAEEELRDSEERFRALVQFSFDVYWETDAQHRFVRQEFAEGLAGRAGAGLRDRQDSVGSALPRAGRRGLAQAPRDARCPPAIP